MLAVLIYPYHVDQGGKAWTMTKVHTLRNKIIWNVMDPAQNMITFLDRKGFFGCGRCQGCRVENNNVKRRNTFKVTDTVNY